MYCFFFFFFFNDTATTEIYTLSLHDALPIWRQPAPRHLRTAMVSSLPRTNARTLVATPIPPTMRATRPVSPRYTVSWFQKRRTPGWAWVYVVTRTLVSVRRAASASLNASALEPVGR